MLQLILAQTIVARSKVIRTRFEIRQATCSYEATHSVSVASQGGAFQLKRIDIYKEIALASFAPLITKTNMAQLVCVHIVDSPLNLIELTFHKRDTCCQKYYLLSR